MIFDKLKNESIGLYKQISFRSVFVCILTLGYTSFSYGQIGINTENPQALLHIDGASTPATTNPSSGTITDAQALDDIVITNDGNIGIGTLSPSAKVSIVTTGSVKGISIIDGTEGANKVLVSDDNGIGKWSYMAGSWMAILNAAAEIIVEPNKLGNFDFKYYASGLLSNPSQGAIDIVNGVITVPISGYYKITIFASIVNNSNIQNDNYYQISLGIKINGMVSNWNPCSYSLQNYGNSSSFSTMIELKANDVISGYLDRNIYDRAAKCSSFSMIIEYYK